MKVKTDFPIAYESHDHKVPSGTANDNTHQRSFVRQTERIFGRKVNHADLGCSGGGLVKDFVDYGHNSIGIEGSDYSQKIKRAEWGTIPDRLFTADITKPFQIVDDEDNPVQCDIITAWEVMEHIQREDLPALFENLRNNLVDGGLFVASVATFPDEGYHVTLEEEPWWLEQFAAGGFVPVDELLYDESHMVRQSSFYVQLKKV